MQKNSETFVMRIMSSTLLDISLPLDLLGMLSWRRQKLSLNSSVMLACCWWLETEFGEVFQWYQIVLEGQTASTSMKPMMKQSKRNTSPISMQTIFMDGQCACFFLLEASSGCSVAAQLKALLTLTTCKIFLVYLKVMLWNKAWISVISFYRWKKLKTAF